MTLAGTNIIEEVLSSSRISDITNSFYYSNHKNPEKKALFKKKLSLYLSNPKKNKVFTISNESGKLLAFITLNFSNPSILQIPFLRVKDTNIKKTLALHLLYKTVLEAVNLQTNLIIISDDYLSKNTKDVLNESSFIPVNNLWVKVNISGIHSLSSISKILDNVYSDSKSPYDLAIKRITEIVKELKLNFSNDICFKLEKYLYPVKIFELEIPCYIIPIKLEWATLLFEERLNRERLGLFNENKHLILNRKNVYYRSAKTVRLKSPARILWYSSETKGYSGEIAATSYIDHISIGKPKDLFKKYQNLGVYEWPDIMKLAHGNLNTHIMAFQFSDTILFEKKLYLNKIKCLYRSIEGKDFNPVAPVKISSHLYNTIYKYSLK